MRFAIVVILIAALIAAAMALTGQRAPAQASGPADAAAPTPPSAAPPAAASAPSASTPSMPSPEHQEQQLRDAPTPIAAPAAAAQSAIIAPAATASPADAPAIEPLPAADPLAERLLDGALISLQVADGARLAADWERSLYGRLWQDPMLAGVRQALLARAREAAVELGFDPLDLLRQQRGVLLRLTGWQDEHRPRFSVQAELGPLAKAVFDRLARPPQGVPRPIAQVPDADEAVGEEDGVLARFGEALVFAAHLPAERRALPAPAAAATLAIDAQAAVQAFGAILPPERRGDHERVLAQWQPYLGRIAYRGELVPEGVRERLTSDRPLPGAAPVQRDLLERLPATTLLMLAVGVDGRAYWQVHSAALLALLDAAWHPEDPQGPEATLAEADQALATHGIEGGLQRFVEGLNGTFLVAITPGVPFPALTLVLPRSAGIDQWVALVAREGGQQPPIPGRTVTIRLPEVQLPAPLQLANAREHWVLTTDAQVAQGWIAGRPGGFLDSPAGRTLLAAAPPAACILGASDTPNVVRTIQGYLGFLFMAGLVPPEQQPAATDALIRLADLVQPGCLVAVSTPAGARIEARGLIGSGLLPAVIGGALVALGQAGEAEPDAAPEEDPSAIEEPSEPPPPALDPPPRSSPRPLP